MPTDRRFRTADIDLAAPLPAIQLLPDESGIGVLVRRDRRPVGYLLEKWEAGKSISPQELADRIAAECATGILADAVAKELCPPPAAAPDPGLTLAVCTRNRVAQLRRCLSSLVPLRARHGWEILVVDNAPPDESTAELVAEFPGVRYVREAMPGLDPARNRAVAETRTPWIVFFDDDVVVDPDWGSAWIAALADHPEAEAFTGLVLPLTLDTTAQVLFEQRGGFRRGFVRRRYGTVLPGNPLFPAGAGIFGTGCNMMFRTDTLRELGGFDDALDTGRPLPGGGDLDMFYRLVAAGRVLVYDPGLLVFHEHRRELRALRHQYYTWGLGLMAYAGKHLADRSAARPLFQRLVRWWFRDMLRQLRDAVRGRHPLPSSLVAAELWGGMVGLAGEYGRSRRRMSALRDAS